MKHELYRTGDSDAPQQLLDRNGEVALQQCRKCGLAECELVEQPICTGARQQTW